MVQRAAEKLVLATGVVVMFLVWRSHGAPYALLPIPFFAALLGAEVVLSKLRGRRDFGFNATVDNLCLGSLQRGLVALHPLYGFGLYLAVYEHRLFHLPGEGPGAVLACLLAYDFAFYWAHRKSHEVNVLWAAHVVHHQSEEFNLSVSFRQGPFQYSFYFFFFLPLALVGFDPLSFMVATVVHQLCQFVVHARVSGSLGWIEAVLITPSTHGVHHAMNGKYLDKNFGGILSIWDRMFGTYQAEDPELAPVYGIVRQLGSWNPVAAVVAPWSELVRRTGRARSGGELLRVWLGRPSEVDRVLADAAPVQRRTPALPWGLKLYGLVQMLSAGAVTLVLMDAGRELGSGARVGLFAWLVATLFCAGGIFDARPWAAAAEGTRILALAALAAVLGLSSQAGAVPGVAIAPGLPPLLAAFAVLSGLWLHRQRKLLPPSRLLRAL